MNAIEFKRFSGIELSESSPLWWFINDDYYKSDMSKERYCRTFLRNKAEKVRFFRELETYLQSTKN